jgi:hypothetical protein
MISFFAPSHVLAALLFTALAATPSRAAVVVPHPMVTPPPSLVERTPSKVQERGIISDVESLGNYLSSVVGTYPSYIASGIPNFFQDFPTGSAVQSSLGISDSDLAATPTQVLSVPYVRLLWGNACANPSIEVMQIGPTKAGTCDFTAMCSSSPTSPNRNSMSWPMFSWLALPSNSFHQLNRPKRET